MYSIQTIIVGVPITSKVAEAIEKSKKDAEELGFEVLYHGGSDGLVGYCGVQLGDDLDECGDWTRIDQGRIHQHHERLPDQVAVTVATPEQEQEARRKVDALPSSVRKACQEFGIYIVYSSS